MRKILTAVTALILAGTMAAGMASCGDKDKKESSTSENMLVGGQFTEADKFIITTLHDKLIGDRKLKKNAQTSDLQLFAESIFPKVFDDAAQESYVEQTEAFTSMFEQKAKYSAIMAALAEMLYKEFNRP